MLGGGGGNWRSCADFASSSLFLCMPHGMTRMDDDSLRGGQDLLIQGQGSTKSCFQESRTTEQ